MTKFYKKPFIKTHVSTFYWSADPQQNDPELGEMINQRIVSAMRGGEKSLIVQISFFNSSPIQQNTSTSQDLHSTIRYKACLQSENSFEQKIKLH